MPLAWVTISGEFNCVITKAALNLVELQQILSFEIILAELIDEQRENYIPLNEGNTHIKSMTEKFKDSPFEAR